MPPSNRPRPKPKPHGSTTNTPTTILKGKPPKNASSHKITSVVLGNKLIPVWYSSLYPPRAVIDGGSERIYVCEHCFGYSGDVAEVLGHQSFCDLSTTASEPLGKQVYAKGDFSIYEVDGEEHTLFCQCLSLFAKLFLDTKSISYDVEPFLFYTLVEHLPPTVSPAPHRRIVGFFSKEKMSWDGNILACILVFPPYQRRGLGKVLISFSYELARIERKLGGPEKPLSDLGQKGYKSYWTSALATTILNKKFKKPITIADLSEETWIHQEDVVATLKGMGAIGRSAEESGGWVISKSRVRGFVASTGIQVGNESGGIDVSGIIIRGRDE